MRFRKHEQTMFRLPFWFIVQSLIDRMPPWFGFSKLASGAMVQFQYPDPSKKKGSVSVSRCAVCVSLHVCMCGGLKSI